MKEEEPDSKENKEEVVDKNAEEKEQKMEVENKQ